jgi:hypothetical protein
LPNRCRLAPDGCFRRRSDPAQMDPCVVITLEPIPLTAFILVLASKGGVT